MITFRAWNPKATARYDSVRDHYHDATSGRRLRNRLYNLQVLAANGVVVIR